MAVKINKKRVMITLPRRQVEWLYDFCSKHDITLSHYISWILTKKAEEMLTILKLQHTPYTENELNEALRIIKTKWVDPLYDEIAEDEIDRKLK